MAGRSCGGGARLNHDAWAEMMKRIERAATETCGDILGTTEGKVTIEGLKQDGTVVLTEPCIDQEKWEMLTEDLNGLSDKYKLDTGFVIIQGGLATPCPGDRWVNERPQLDYLRSMTREYDQRQERTLRRREARRAEVVAREQQAYQAAGPYYYVMDTPEDPGPGPIWEDEGPTAVEDYANTYDGPTMNDVVVAQQQELRRALLNQIQNTVSNPWPNIQETTQANAEAYDLRA